MKGLILCGGTGSRLWPITLSIPKQLIPIGNKPVLFYILDSLVQANIRDIGIIVNHNEAVFKEALTVYNNKHINITFINQNQPIGLANAVLEAEHYIDYDSFLMVLGDNFYDINLNHFVNDFLSRNLNCQLLLKEVNDPHRFGVAEVNEVKIVSLVEKPKDPPSNLAITGIYLFDKRIFDGCKAISPSFRGEFEITDAIKWLLDHGYSIGYQITQKGWQDLGKPEDILESNRNILNVKDAYILGEITEGCKVTGTIDLGKNSKIIDSIVRGPVTIGENSIIKNAEIGPYASIGKEVYIENTRIQNSIIFDQCFIKHINNIIDESIVGSGSKIESSIASKVGHHLILGKNSKVALG